MATQKAQPRKDYNSTSNTSRRPRPMAPKAGVTKTRTRYGNGGKCSK